jgi:hypothetical protein
MIPLVPQRSDLAAPGGAPAVPGSPEWLRLARLAGRCCGSHLAGSALRRGSPSAAVVAGSVALLGSGLDSGIEALASIIVIWRFTGTHLTGSSW